MLVASFLSLSLHRHGNSVERREGTLTFDNTPRPSPTPPLPQNVKHSTQSCLQVHLSLTSTTVFSFRAHLWAPFFPLSQKASPLLFLLTAVSWHWLFPSCKNAFGASESFSLLDETRQRDPVEQTIGLAPRGGSLSRSWKPHLVKSGLSCSGTRGRLLYCVYTNLDIIYAEVLWAFVQHCEADGDAGMLSRERTRR